MTVCLDERDRKVPQQAKEKSKHKKKRRKKNNFYVNQDQNVLHPIIKQNRTIILTGFVFEVLCLIIATISVPFSAKEHATSLQIASLRNKKKKKSLLKQK